MRRHANAGMVAAVLILICVVLLLVTAGCGGKIEGSGEIVFTVSSDDRDSVFMSAEVNGKEVLSGSPEPLPYTYKAEHVGGGSKVKVRVWTGQEGSEGKITIRINKPRSKTCVSPLDTRPEVTCEVR